MCNPVQSVQSVKAGCSYFRPPLQPHLVGEARQEPSEKGKKRARKMAFRLLFSGPGPGEVASISTVAPGSCLPQNRLYTPLCALVSSRGSMALPASCLTLSRPFPLELACHRDLLCNPSRRLGFGIFFPCIPTL